RVVQRLHELPANLDEPLRGCGVVPGLTHEIRLRLTPLLTLRGRNVSHLRTSHELVDAWRRRTPMLEQRQRRHVVDARRDRRLDGPRDECFVYRMTEIEPEESGLHTAQLVLRDEVLRVAVEMIDRRLARLERACDADVLRDVPDQLDPPFAPRFDGRV